MGRTAWRWLTGTGTIAVALSVYAFVLSVSLPYGVASAARRGFVSVPFLVLLYPAWTRPGRMTTLASLSLTLVAFGLPLAGVWGTGRSDGGIIGGILPYSDAGAYFADASRLLHGALFSEFSGRRPLFPAVLAGILALTKFNLQFTLAALVAINAAACLIASREVRDTHGALAGLVVLTLLFCFYRPHTGHLLTENLGLALGALAFAVLWRGAGQDSLRSVCFGILLMSLAMMARVGTLLVLPALVLWAATCFRATRLSIAVLVAGLLAVVLGFALNAVLLRTVTAPDTVPFGNYVYALYGLATGGKGWTQIFTDHPEVFTLRAAEQYGAIRGLAVAEIQRNPMGLIVGCVKAWKDFFDPLAGGAFSFVFVNPRWAAATVCTVLYCFSAIGVARAVAARHDRRNSLLLALLIGIVASVPSAPPSDADSMRGYAVTMTVPAVLVALGVSASAQKLKMGVGGPAHPRLCARQIECIHGWGLALVGLCVLGPLVATLLSKERATYGGPTCPEGLEPLYVRAAPGAAVKLVDDLSAHYTHVPNVRLADFRRELPTMALYPELMMELSQLGAGTTIMDAPYLDGSGIATLVGETPTLQGKDGPMMVCARRRANLRYVSSLREVGIEDGTE